MNRLSPMFHQSRKAKRKILSVFVTAGYPNLESTPDLVRTLENSGVDLVEIGIPFSDPIADGPTIQYSSKVALDNGMNLRLALDQVKIIRQKSRLPIIMMGYLNPILKFGLASFVREAESVGVDGLIVPDILPEEYDTLKSNFANSSLGLSFLISPNTTSERIKQIDTLTKHFIYCVSVTGVTGSRTGLPPNLADFLKSVRAIATHPLLVGFGISNAESAKSVAKFADGIIVGSAIIDLITKSKDRLQMIGAVGQFVNELKTAIREF